MKLYILPRHISDAAWHYTQFDADRASALVDIDRLRHYQRVFVAHLDGLRFGGEASVEIALEQLQRWKGRGELFVCWHLAHDLQHPILAETAWNFLVAHPQPHFIDAAATALLWLPAEKARSAIEQLIASKIPLALQVALNACGLRRERFEYEVLLLFQHESTGVRAEVCRYAGRLRYLEVLPYLHKALADEQADVREQAAVALFLCNESHTALPELYAAVQKYAALVDAGEGAASIRAENRAQHLARLLGHAIPFLCRPPMMEDLSKELPPYLFLLMLAHHGDPAHIDLLLSFMRETDETPLQGVLYKRRALWAMCFMLGINPETEGLLADEPSLSADWPKAPGLDQDSGLPEPDAHKVECWWNAHQAIYVPTNAPYLMGTEMRELSSATLWLVSGTQAQRFAASLHTIRIDKQAPWVDTRAPLALQSRLGK